MHKPVLVCLYGVGARAGGRFGGMRLKAWQFSILVGLMLIAGCVAVRWWDPVPLKVMRLKTFDVFQRIEPREPTPLPVAVIDIDDPTLAAYGQWPWPRTLIADLIGKLTAVGTTIVGFDIVFPEADRTSPDRIVEQYQGLAQAARDALLAIPNNDNVMAATIARIPTVLGQSTTPYPSAHNEGRPKAVKATYAWKSTRAVGEGGGEGYQFLLPNPGITRNIETLENGAAGLGVFNIDAEIDSVVRNVPLIFRGEDNVIYPTLSVEMLRVATGQKTVGIKWDPRIGIVSILFKGLEIPTDEKGRAWLHFAPWTQERREAVYISARDVLDGRVSPDRLQRRWVILGTSAVGLLDIKATPLDPFVPGVDIHAQLLESIMLYIQQLQLAAQAEAEGKGFDVRSPFLHRPNDAIGVELVTLVGVGVALMFAVPLLGAAWGLLVVLVAIGGQLGGAWAMFSLHGQLYDMVYPAITSFVLYTALTYLNYVREQAQKKQVRTAFAQYLSPALVEQLADHPDQLRLGGERRGMTIMFSDIRGFTSISETFKTDPEGLVRLINRYLTPMTDLIMAKGGTIDKYMGDAIMAFWNAPITDDDHGRHACTTALAMQAKTRELNAQLEAEATAAGRAFVPINIGVGVNSGEVFVGNMGSDQRFDYSVIGDDVNLASRLEGQSKTYGVGIVIGENTKARADDFALLELDLIQVKGKAEAVRVFTVLGDPAHAATPAFRDLAERHAAMLAAYRRQDWAGARALVAESRALDGALAALYDLYDERLDIYEANPPGPDWDGVFVATSK
ncbi:MAG: adenylate/guanylate cyclase domain-containing protein [Alphaproteobacteria bacterium]|nr:adenylate/guanylate cyclase domain-containing protein [Alphaproteobacteria bacterium]